MSLLPLLSGCDRAPPGENSELRKTTEESADTRSVEIRDQAAPIEAERTAKELDLTLESYPADGAENLFAGEEEAEYDFFQSQEKDPSVKLKGKLYLKEEVAPEQRLENVDGGEVEVRVPLR